MNEAIGLAFILVSTAFTPC